MSRPQSYVLVRSSDQIDEFWVLEPRAQTDAEAKRSIRWLIKGGGKRRDYIVATWDASGQVFRDRAGMGYPLIRGPHTEEAFEHFLDGLPKPPSELRTPGLRRWRVTVELDVPVDATRDDVKAYAEDAIGTMVGCYRPPGGHGNDDPGDPVWGLDNVEVLRVTRVNQKKGTNHEPA